MELMGLICLPTAAIRYGGGCRGDGEIVHGLCPGEGFLSPHLVCLLSRSLLSVSPLSIPLPKASAIMLQPSCPSL